MPICPNCKTRNPEAGEVCENDGFFFVEEAALEAAGRDNLIGRCISDRFAVMGIIGHGGMGSVYEALQFPVRRRVAMKVLKNEIQSSSRLQERFKREARAIASLNHPNIVTLFDFGIDNRIGVSYIAMECVEGRLLSAVDPISMDLNFIVHVTTQILAALKEAHGHSIIHRDLKPENVMLTTVGSNSAFVKVLDFGLAVLAEGADDVRLTGAGEVFGTPLYMSPEQASGDDHITPAADIYSLGCMMFEMLTGEVPFIGDRPMNILLQHINAPIPIPMPRPGLNPTPEFTSIITRCMQKDALDRFQSANELMQAIYDTREGIPSRPLPSHEMLLSDLEDMATYHSGAIARPSSEPTSAPFTPRGLSTNPSPIRVELEEIPVGRPVLPSDPTPLKNPESSIFSTTVDPVESPAGGGWFVLVALVVLLIAGVVGLYASGMLDTDTPDAASLEAQDEENEVEERLDPSKNLELALEVTQQHVVDAMRDGIRDLRIQTVLMTFDKALSDPTTASPGKNIGHFDRKKKAWPERIHRAHIKNVQNKSYIDIIDLVFSP